MKKLIKSNIKSFNTVQAYASCACGCGCLKKKLNATATNKAQNRTNA